MGQELTSISNKTVAVIGGGPAGCICAKFLSDAGIDVTVFDKGKLLRTLLPTGGGRCNLAHADFDFKSLAQNYPRGEKFLYSVFSKFGTNETLKFFKSIGVETYIQEDNRIFPNSNSSADVREKFLNSLKSKLIKENVITITPLSNGYEIETEKSKYYFDKVVISVGGHNGYGVLKKMDINIIEPVPCLVGLICKEDFSSVAGVSIKNVKAKVLKNNFKGDLLFTHNGISGPLIYTISSVFAREKFPYKVNLRFTDDFDFQKLLNEFPHKEIKNLMSQFIPKSFAYYLLSKLNINLELPCHKINAKMRNNIYTALTNFEIIIKDKVPDGEVVTCGGVDLKEINPKTMGAKKYDGLYFCGEVLDIDGFCGGFNLQNCWSTGFVCADSIISNINNCAK